MIPVIVIEGATATGKTALSMQLAERFQTEIISADSRQVYKYLDIGTAKPTLEQQSQVKHHLINIIYPDGTYNAGTFRKDAINIIQYLYQSGKIPILAGGTGLYIKALLEGLFETDAYDQLIRQKLAEECHAKGLDALYVELTAIDPEAAQRISNNDKHRILRALEVFRTTGRTLTEHWKNQERSSGLKPFRILLQEERKTLYKSIDERVGEMINQGLLSEIGSVLSQGYKWTDPGFNTVGYKEFQPYFIKQSELNTCVEFARQHTRNYAKRQETWYRKSTFNLTNNYAAINLSSIEELILNFFDTKKPEESDGNSCPSI